MDRDSLACSKCKGTYRPFVRAENGTWMCNICGVPLGDKYGDKIHHFYSCPEKKKRYFCECRSLTNDKDRYYNQ